jgi:hypothetical protein
VTTKILALNLMRLVLLPGQLFDTVVVPPLIEGLAFDVKDFKRIAVRADKTDQSFASMIHLAAAMINSR